MVLSVENSFILSVAFSAIKIVADRIFKNAFDSLHGHNGWRFPIFIYKAQS